MKALETLIIGGIALALCACFPGDDVAHAPSQGPVPEGQNEKPSKTGEGSDAVKPQKPSNPDKPAGGEDKKDDSQATAPEKPGAGERPEADDAPGATTRYDGDVPEDLRSEVAKANEFNGMNMLGKLKEIDGNGNAVFMYEGEKGVAIGGKWASAQITPNHGGFQGYQAMISTGSGLAHYEGPALSKQDMRKGKLSYHIHFDERKGWGEIKGIPEFAGVADVEKIVLNPVSFDYYFAKGDAVILRKGQTEPDRTARTHETPVPLPLRAPEGDNQPELAYAVGVYGSDRNEVAGDVGQNKMTHIERLLVFHGVRQPEKKDSK